MLFIYQKTVIRKLCINGSLVLVQGDLDVTKGRRNMFDVISRKYFMLILILPKTSSSDHRKRPRDPSQLAKLIVDIAAGETEDRPPTPEEQGNDPAAVALGRKGGLKGGKARAKCA